jgi:hypothetical protein
MKKLYITLIAIASLTFSGCTPPQSGSPVIDTGRFTVETSEYIKDSRGLDFIVVIADKNTSVQYLVVVRDRNIAITPLVK